MKVQTNQKNKVYDKIHTAVKHRLYKSISAQQKRHLDTETRNVDCTVLQALIKQMGFLCIYSRSN